MADEIRHLKVKSPPADLHIARISPRSVSLSHSQGLIANKTGWPFDGLFRCRGRRKVPRGRDINSVYFAPGQIDAPRILEMH